ncbi:MAG: plastocyanin/azurin family copper-binding protein [Candidatus Eremiobacteraeota bacterium]|nr:plastocyanin/azurin family copper-binding protein [Candidatus Eremiobacteraeota bacterium]
MTFRNLGRLALAFLFLPAIAACSSTSTTSQPPPPDPRVWLANVGTSTTDGSLQGLNFYPSAMTIDAGDSVSWTIMSTNPHTISLFPAGQGPQPGPPDLAPHGGSTYDGTSLTSSGLVIKGTVYRLTFTKPGTYTVYCLIHGPEMVGTITVQAAGSAYPTTQGDYQVQGAASATSDIANAASSILQFPFASGGTQVAAGIAPGLVTGPPSHSTVLRFINSPSAASSTVTVPVGGTVTWYNLSNNEPHTVTFGIAGQPFPSLNPFGPPMGGPTYDGTAITSSGVMPPVPGINTYSLRFTKAGTYQYRCLIHDDDSGMIGTVIVQ